MCSRTTSQRPRRRRRIISSGNVGFKRERIRLPFAREPTLPDYLLVDEAHPLRPEDPYGSSKLVNEDIAEIVTSQYDIPVASLRISNV
ncbi:NAD-dependent epimerase/dehydratase family protein [Natronorubrum halophilum]|uniref:NAD-dependent epimerase/dehydratase family protein n=1 Tax=Natronorubrum halophilum TaxID=1702106 RepID=UPI000EF69948